MQERWSFRSGQETGSSGQERWSFRSGQETGFSGQKRRIVHYRNILQTQVAWQGDRVLKEWQGDRVLQ
jgi:hypothetical protein